MQVQVKEGYCYARPTDVVTRMAWQSNVLFSDRSEGRNFTISICSNGNGGKGELRIGDKRYVLDQSGKVFFCNPGTELLYTSNDSQQGCSFYQLSFRVYEKTGREGDRVFVRKHGDLLAAGEIGSAPYHRIRELANSLHLGKQESTPADAFRIQMLFQEMLIDRRA